MHRYLVAVAASISLLATHNAHAQHTGHAQHTSPDHAQHAAAGQQPTELGQSAFAALAEVTRILMADPNTDWTRVDLERLRQHLIDMSEVALNARVTQTHVAGGVRAEVEGSGRTRDAIRRMALAHSAQPDLLPGVRVSATESAGGATLVITASNPNDTATVAQVRGLGFIGLIVLGSHHGPHHLAIARGDAVHGHH